MKESGPAHGKAHGRLNGQGPSTPPATPRRPKLAQRRTTHRKGQGLHRGGGAPWQRALVRRGRPTCHHRRHRQPAPLEHLEAHRQGRRPATGQPVHPRPGLCTSMPSTGDLKGLLLSTPNDAWDFSGNNSVLLFELQGPRRQDHQGLGPRRPNGFFFVTDRESSPRTTAAIPWKQNAIIGAHPLWTASPGPTGFDLTTGLPGSRTASARPSPSPGQEKGKAVFVSPHPSWAAPTGCR